MSMKIGAEDIHILYAALIHAVHEDASPWEHLTDDQLERADELIFKFEEKIEEESQEEDDDE